MESYFQGKRALVTGAGKGIGRAIAIKLSSLGAYVIGLSRTQSDLDSLKIECPSLQTCLLDISDWDKTRETVEDLGHVDLLVNNAAIAVHCPFLETTKDVLDSTHDTNFRAVFNITQVVAKSMVDNGTGGAIVNISSICGVRAFCKLSAYNASKAALDMLTKTLAVELGPSKIRVNSVNPTFVKTEMGKKSMMTNPETVCGIISATPLGKGSEMEDVVNAVVFLLSDHARMINGVIMPVDGIGRAIAIKLSSLGAYVIGLSRTQSDLDSLKVECPSIQACLLDISDCDKTRKTVEDLGHVELLVNNAAISVHSPFLETTKDVLDRTHDTNFEAVFNITQVVAKRMVANGTGGAIVNISSISGVRAFSKLSAYNTSKAALDMLTKTLALELGPSKIRINSVNPTIVNTEMGKKSNPDIVKGLISATPLGKVAEMEDVVNAVVFLLSDHARMINGVIMPVDGGVIVKCI